VSVASRLAASALALAAGLALAADLLLRAQPIGAGATLWALALVAAAALVLRKREVSRTTQAIALGAAVVFALLLSWRTAPLLLLLDLAGLAAALALPLVPQARLATASLVDIARGGMEWGVGLVVGGAYLIRRDVQLRTLQEPLRSGRGTAVARGLLLGGPLVILFAALFATADAVFGNLLADATPHLGGLWSHAFRIAVWFWLAGGVLWVLGGRSRTFVPHFEAAPPLRLGAVEVTLVLVLLDLLFGAFVLVQSRAFFGGQAWVQSHAHLTYAQYARQGFFQLLAVAGLALALVVLLDWAQERRSAATTVLAAIFVLLVAAVMVSALQRMRLYQREYGLTELRLYSTAFMLWLAVVLAWLGATVLRGRRERFAAGLVGSGLVAIVALNLVNPDALIARVNLDRAAEGKQVDYSYLRTLSADAAPTLAGQVDARAMASLVACDTGWRSWNLSRNRAQDVVCPPSGDGGADE